MHAIADYPAFAAAVVLFLAIPGPGNLALVASTGFGGIRGGVAATLGVIAGDQVLMWLAVGGMAAVIAANPAAFAFVQWGGAAYLAWLGWRMLRERGASDSALRIRPRHFFRQAFAITLLNPKAVVFYMAFFPLFVDPARGPGLATFAAMAATVAVLTFAYGLAVTLLAHRLAEHLRAAPRLARALRVLAGVTMIGFGLRLALR